MATPATLNVPLYTLTLPPSPIAYLTGTSPICLSNPWITLPGYPTPSFKDYLTIKKITGEMPGYSITSPQILYKHNSTYTPNIVFTEDSNENSLTTKFTPFKLWQTELKDYGIKFKKMQKITCSRGKYTPTSPTTPELTLNYYLTQAIELAILLKIFGLAPTSDTTDSEVLESLYSEFESITKTIKDEDEQSDYKTKLKKLSTAIQNYLKFNSSDNTSHYLTQGLETSKKAVSNDLFDIFKDVMAIKAENLGEKEKMFEEYYKALTADGKIPYIKPIQPACFIKHFKTTIDNKPIEGTSIYTNYIFKCGEFGNTLTKKTQKGKLVPLTISDHAKMAGKPQIGKFYIKIDYDIRIYPKVATNSPTSLRYDVKILLYKPNDFNSSTNIEGIENIDIGMDDENIEEGIDTNTVDLD